MASHPDRARRNRRLAFAIPVLAVIACLSLPLPAAAVLTLTLAPNSGYRGATVEATAAGFEPPPGEVTFWWDGTLLLGVDPTIAGGQATLAFKVPSDASFGKHAVRACHGSACIPGQYVDAEFTVLSRPRATPTPPPTPKPTPTPSLLPTAPPTAGPSAGPTPTPGSSPVATLGPGIPLPSFPLAGPTAPPTDPPLVAITPAPQPPSDEGAPETDWPNLYVAGIEVTQGIQNLANDMPLVQDRRTYARVYIGVTGAQSWPNTWGALEARRGGQQVGWIWPENGPIIARASGGDRTSLDDSLQFRLPASWLSGSVTLTTFVFSYGIETPFTEEPNAADNTDSEFVTFHEAQPLTVHLAPLHLHRSYHPTDVERIYGLEGGVDDLAGAGTTSGGTNRIVSGLFRFLPLWKVNVDTIDAPIFPIGHAGGHEFDLGGQCKATVLEVSGGHLVISDWTILVDDPADYEPGVTYLDVPRDELKVMDRTYSAGQFTRNEDGTADIYGGHDNLGPDPVPGAPVYAYGCSFVTDEMGEPLSTLALYRVFYDWADEREMFVGMIDPSLRAPFAGLASSGSDAVWVRMSDSFGDVATWDHTGAGTMGHEAGHLGGLSHVPCKDNDGDGVPDELIGGALDLTHPMTLTFPDCKLAEVEPDGYYGFDTSWQLFGLDGPTALSNDPAVAGSNRAYPFMGYKNPGWSDPYHYCRLLTYYGVPCSPTQLGLPWNPPNPEPDGSDPLAANTPPPSPLEPGVGAMTIQYTGLEDGGWSLDVLARTSTPTPHQVEQIAAERRLPPDPERPWIVVLDADGAVRWQAILPAPERPHDAEPGPEVGGFVVPVWPDTTAVEIRDPDARVRARVEPKGGYPEIAGLFKDTADGETIEPDDEIIVSFEAGDPDGDPLRLFVLYAPDREHWRLVGVAEDEREIPVPVADLPSGDDPAFRLVAFDGWGIGEATLPAPELAAPRNPPTVLILASEPHRYPRQFPVRLEASAFDLEDRALPGDAIRWSSSIDGDLGSGGELVTSELSVGRHLITATATDSDGLTGSATHELEVDGSVVNPVPGEDLASAMAGILERLGAGLDPAPAVEDHPDFAWLPIGIAGGAALLLLAGVAGYVVARGRPRPVASPAAGGYNELSMDDTAGKERSSSAGVGGNETITIGANRTEAADGDMTLKGSKIKEN